MPNLNEIFAIVGVCYLTWLVARHGIGWVWQKLQGTYAAAQADAAQAEADTKAGLDVLKSLAPASTPTTVPVAPAPAASTGVTGTGK